MAASLAFLGASEMGFLAGLSSAGDQFHSRIPQLSNAATALFRSSVQDFVRANPNLAVQMRNEAKTCPRCQKSNATMLVFCNGCGMDLNDASVGYTENVCMGFVYGVEHGSHGPLRLSLRLETPDVLVYDDLLARGSLHVNAIPADCHLPDWRHLLRSPAKGKALVQRLDDACWQVVKEQFCKDQLWWTRTFREGAFASVEDLRAGMFAGINAVPSQFQIHLQYIGPAITPSDYHQFLWGKRLVRERWLPLEYVIGSLEALERSPEAAAALRDAHTMPMDAIFQAIAEFGGPVYEKMYAQAIRRYNQTYRKCANWQPEHFDFIVIERHPNLRSELLGAAGDSDPTAGAIAQVEVRPLRADSACVTLPSLVELEKRDKAAIMSYGKLVDSGGKPLAQTYYSFARQPGDVQAADAWAA